MRARAVSLITSLPTMASTLHTVEIEINANVNTVLVVHDTHNVLRCKPTMALLTNNTNVLPCKRRHSPSGGPPLGYDALCGTMVGRNDVCHELDWLAAEGLDGMHAKFIFHGPTRLSRHTTHHTIGASRQNKVSVGSVVSNRVMAHGKSVTILIHRSRCARKSASIAIPSGFSCAINATSDADFTAIWQTTPRSSEVILSHAPSACCQCSLEWDECTCVDRAVDDKSPSPFEKCAACSSADGSPANQCTLFCDMCMDNLVEWKANLTAVCHGLSTTWRDVCRAECTAPGTCRMRASPFARPCKPTDAPLNPEHWEITAPCASACHEG